MKLLVFLIIMVISNMTLANWEPPEGYDFHQLLDEAVEDRKNNEYESSLIKHIWFHENVLKYDESFYGVRLSYAISEWYELARVYPKAMERMNYYSDRAKERVKEEVHCCHEAFHEFVSINTEMDRTQLIVSLFKWADSNDKKAALRIYNLAQPALILAGEYEICGEYIQPEKNFKSYEDMYGQNIEFNRGVEQALVGVIPEPWP